MGHVTFSLQGSRMDEQRCSFPPPLKVGWNHSLAHLSVAAYLSSLSKGLGTWKGWGDSLPRCDQQLQENSNPGPRELLPGKADGAPRGGEGEMGGVAGLPPTLL